MNTGAPHDSPLRQLITPFPYSPPTMNAAFLTSGITAAQRVRVHRSSGIVGRIACTTFAALARRNASAAEMAPAALDTVATTAIAAKANLFIGHLWQPCCNAAAISSDNASAQKTSSPQESRALVCRALAGANEGRRQSRPGHAVTAGRDRRRRRPRAL